MSVLLDMVLPSTLRPPPCQWDPADPSCCRMSSSWMRWVILTGSESPKEWFTPRAVERLGTLKLLMTSQSTARRRSLTQLERRPHAWFASQQLVSEFMTKIHLFDKINLSSQFLYVTSYTAVVSLVNIYTRGKKNMFTRFIWPITKTNETY